MAVSVVNMQLIYVSIAIMQVSMSVCIFAGYQMLLSVTSILVDLSVTVMQVTVSVAVMQLEVFCSTYAGDSFCSKCGL